MKILNPYAARVINALATSLAWFKSRAALLAVMLSLGLTSSFEARAIVVFMETFDTPTTTTAQTLAQYPAFSFTGGGSTSAVVSSGVLNIGPRAGDAASPMIFDVGGFAGDLIITANLTNMTASGNYNVGISVGANQILFHPGFAGTSAALPQGSFRVDGPNGFANRNMGFIPTTMFHEMVITIIEATGAFTVEITDSGSGNVYADSFTLPNYSAFDRIGFQTGGFVGVGISKFSDLKIETTIPVTEPSTLAILGLGLAGLGVMRKRSLRP